MTIEKPTAESGEEFEIVLGRTQLASVLFVAIMVVALSSAIFYLVGKSTGVKAAPPVAAIVPAPAAVPAAQEVRQAVMQAPPAPVTAVAAPAAAKAVTNPAFGPLFNEPVAGSLYIQMAAVEKGIAVVFAEGLRSRGLPGFVAPGPSENLNRVLIGPLSTPEALAQAKEELTKIGVTTFAKRFEK